MAKRFTDTAKWQDEWFYDLRPECKLLFFFMCDHCDACGVWKVNRRFAEATIGMVLNWDQVILDMGDKLKVLAGGKKWFLPKFIAFQYHGGLAAGNRIHECVRQLLRDHGIDPTPYEKNQPDSALSGRPLVGQYTAQATEKEKASGEGESAERGGKGAQQREDMAAACRGLFLPDAPRALEEWITGLREDGGCQSVEEAIACMEWAVNGARDAGKDVSYMRHVVTMVRQWKQRRTEMIRKKALPVTGASA